MGLWFNDAYLTVWEMRSNASGSYSINISNSTKQLDGSWVTDFRGWAVLTKSAYEQLSNATIPSPDGEPPLRIKASGYHTAYFDKEKNKNVNGYRITRCEIVNNNNLQQETDTEDDPF